MSVTPETAMRTLIKRCEAQMAAWAERAEVLKGQVRAVVPAVAERYRVEAVWLFGSLAWGRPDAASDVDIAVMGLRPELRDDFAGELWMAIDASVDVVLLETAATTLRERVLVAGIPLYKRTA